MKTIKEFKNEVKEIRMDIRKNGNKADNKLLASWIDRLLISLEGVTPTLDLMQEEIDQLSKIGTTMEKSKVKIKKDKVKKIKTEKKEKSNVKNEKVKKEKKEEKGFWPF